MKFFIKFIYGCLYQFSPWRGESFKFKSKFQIYNKISHLYQIFKLRYGCLYQFSPWRGESSKFMSKFQSYNKISDLYQIFKLIFGRLYQFSPWTVNNVQIYINFSNLHQLYKFDIIYIKIIYNIYIYGCLYQCSWRGENFKFKSNF